jgi:hypothetical protein
MENQDDLFELKDFVRKIIAIDIGMLLVASVVALSLHVEFGVILFVLGMVAAVVGASLGGSPAYLPKNPPMQQSRPDGRPAAVNLSARVLHSLKNAVPQYAFENVLLFAGSTAILISTPFLCQIMF